MPAAPIRVFVTGASGFVGRHLMAALAAAYPDATLLQPNLKLQDAAAVAAAVRDAKPDVCIHLAAISAIREAQQAPDLAWQVNLYGTVHLAWALLRHAPDCLLVFASSADAYGASFGAGVPLDETAPLAPMNVYAETKATADLLLGGMATQGLRVLRLRPFNHIGPGQSADFVVASFARQVALIAAGRQPAMLQVGNLNTWRDFLDVRDVCAAYLACIDRRDLILPGSILNIASGQPRRIGDVLSELVALAGIDVQIEVDASRVRATDIQLACGNPARAAEHLGWRPGMAWQQTLQDILADWRVRIEVVEE